MFAICFRRICNPNTRVVMTKRFFICIDSEAESSEIAQHLFDHFNASVVAIDSDLEVINDWVSNKHYDEMKKPSDDWDCIASAESM